ncbi:SRPBCC family protein [Haladaptatus sp. DFWS20]|uniref:SRPBCC family protein n=1 Tax=Haladaptatus sp. DFWS20 TaxID=3403467 RepID=UPI003EBF455D
MSTFEHTIEIEAPVEHVFEFDSNPRNWPKTMPSLQDLEIIEETDDEIRMCATYKMLGLSIDSTMQLTIVKPNEHMVLTIESPEMTGKVNQYLSETDSGTRIVHQSDHQYDDSLLNRLLKPLANRYNERQVKNHLQNTKELIEAQVSDEATIEV